MNKKILFIVLGIVILLAGGVFAWHYFETQEKRAETPVEIPVVQTPAETEDETAEWNIYRNETFGFEVKHPTNWLVDTYYNVPFLIRFDTDNNNFLTEEEFKARYGDQARYEWRFWNDIEIKVYTSPNELPGNEDNLNLEEWIKMKMDGYSILRNSKKEITINKYKGIEVVETGYTSWRSVFLPYNKFIYKLSIMINHPEMSAFEQMLSTFRFFDSEEVIKMKIGIDDPVMVPLNGEVVMVQGMISPNGEKIVWNESVPGPEGKTHLFVGNFVGKDGETNFLIKNQKLLLELPNISIGPHKAFIHLDQWSRDDIYIYLRIHEGDIGGFIAASHFKINIDTKEMIRLQIF